MVQDDYDFKGQLKYENFEFFFRRHWVSFLHPVFSTLPIILLVGLILFFLGRLVMMTDFAFMGVAFGFLVILISSALLNMFFLQVIQYYFDLVVVTDCRIIITRKSVFLRNDYNALDLTKIQDIGVESRGLIRNYLGYGKLIITLSTSSPPIAIVYVPNPHFILERANRVKREHIIKRQEGKISNTSQLDAPDSTNYLQDIHDLPTS